MSNQRLVPLNLVALATAPTGGMRTGDLYFNTSDTTVYVYDGTAWAVASGSGALNELSDVDVTGLEDGHVLTWDAATSTWLPSRPAAVGGISTNTVVSNSWWLGA